jgi:methionyl-tRNA synthetase
MTEKYFNGMVPEVAKVTVEGSSTDKEIASLAEGILEHVKRALMDLAYYKALEAIWKLVDRLNKYIDSTEPWHLAKDPAKKSDLSKVLYTCLEGLRFIGLYIYPFMPQTGEAIYRALGYDTIKVDLKEFKWGRLPAGRPIKKGPPLFPRIGKK